MDYGRKGGCSTDVLSLSPLVFADSARTQENVYSNMMTYYAVADIVFDLHCFFYYAGYIWFFFLYMCIYEGCIIDIPAAKRVRENSPLTL